VKEKQFWMPVFLIRDNKMLMLHNMNKYRKGCMILIGADAAGDYQGQQFLLLTLHCTPHYPHREGMTSRA